MVTSPFDFFSRIMDDYGDVETVREQVGNLNNDDDLTFNVNAESIGLEVNPVGTIDGGAMDLGTNTINLQSVDKNYDYYGGCRECYQYSMLFGRVSNNIGTVHNEEEFEKYKMQFVAHFNEKHKDLYEWRKNGKKGKKPITNKEEIEKRKKSSTSGGMITSGMSFYVSDGNHTLNIPTGATLYFNSEPMQTRVNTTLTNGDQIIIDHLGRNGRITARDKKRLDKKYGKSIVDKAWKKYFKSRRVRIESRYGTDLIRGWRS